MIPRQGMSAQEFRPVNRSSAGDKGTSNKESGVVSSNIGKDISQTKNDDQEK